MVENTGKEYGLALSTIVLHFWTTNGVHQWHELFEPISPISPIPTVTSPSIATTSTFRPCTSRSVPQPFPSTSHNQAPTFSDPLDLSVSEWNPDPSYWAQLASPTLSASLGLPDVASTTSTITATSTLSVTAPSVAHLPPSYFLAELPDLPASVSQTTTSSSSVVTPVLVTVSSSNTSICKLVAGDRRKAPST